MVLNKRRRPILAIVLPCVIYGSGLTPLQAQNDSIANERIPVKALQLEAHWKVDCEKSLGDAEDVLNQTGSDSPAIEALIDSVTKCMHIYNTADTVHYKSEPDYRILLDQLKRLSGH